MQQLVTLTTTPVDFRLADWALAHTRTEPNEPGAGTLSECLAAAVAMVEEETRQQLYTATYRLYLDAFPAVDEIVLPRPPLQAVTAVKYLLAGVEQTLAPAKYTVDPPGSKPGRVSLNAGEAWPAADATANSVRVEFTAGYGTDGGLLPPMLRQAVMLLASHWYENREAAGEAQTHEVPLGVRRIMDLHQWPSAV